MLKLRALRAAIAAAVLITAGFGQGAFAADLAPLVTAPHPPREFPMKRMSLEYKDLRHMTVGHPNEEARVDALEAYADNRMNDALSRFQKAASYADKYSQYRVSLMYWYGDGVAADPVQAYVWADLAAERGYKALLATREEIWERLDADQQRRAIENGKALYARYGDAVAKPRMETALKRHKNEMTGSHAGFDAGVQVTFVGEGGSIADAMTHGRSGNEYYADYRWEPKQYWQLEDVFFGKGTVTVGPLQKVDAKPADENAAKTEQQ